MSSNTFSPKATIDKCLANIATHLPGFKQRPAQHQMIAAVADALLRSPHDLADPEVTQMGESIVVIEGPTGTGKSLAYLLPAVVMAKALGKKLVVSSATVMLQEQLANKDIPFLAQHAGLDISYAIAKGRGRYACTYRLKQQAGITKKEQAAENEPVQLEMLDVPLFTKLYDSFTRGTWSGDRDSLPETMPDNVWSQITNDRHGCIKKNCPDFSGCAFYAARKTLEDVDMVIANHDLLLADVAMGGGVILPEPTETFYCLDEAHHLADKAIKQFAASHTINGTLLWLERISGVVSKAMLLCKDYRPNNTITQLAESFANYLQDFSSMLSGFAELRPIGKAATDVAVLRFKHGKIPDVLTELCENLAVAAKLLVTALYLLQEQLKKAKANAEGEGLARSYDRPLIDLGFFVGRVENLVAVWTLFSQQTAQEDPPIAKWITAHWLETKNQNDQIEYTVYASPVSAAKLLTEHFWVKIAGAVLTSATLRSLGKFDLLLSNTGLNNFPAVTCLALESPFDFQRQGSLVVPAMKADPKDPIAHTKEIIALMPTLLPTAGGNGALVLFSSNRQMHDVANGLPPTLRQLLLIQGERSKEILIKEHFARINNNQPSVLFGMASFAEGLDLPGNACNHLIIAKLPFAVPDDPISLTMADWITLKGGNAFMEMTLPMTSIKLIQAVGRLIRSETDIGTVTILDTRLETKYYGKLLRKSLPAFKRVINEEKINAIT